MNENRNFNEDFEIEQAGPEDVGCDLFEYELTPEGTYVPKIAYTSDPELDEIYRKDHPRPTEFNAIRKWEKERLMTLEHQVMEEIVYKRRE